MTTRKVEETTTTTKEKVEEKPRSSWLFPALLLLLVGGIIGFALCHSLCEREDHNSVASNPAPAAPVAAPVTEVQKKVYHWKEETSTKSFKKQTLNRTLEKDESPKDVIVQGLLPECRSQYVIDTEEVKVVGKEIQVVRDHGARPYNVSHQITCDGVDGILLRVSIYDANQKLVYQSKVISCVRFNRFHPDEPEHWLVTIEGNDCNKITTKKLQG